VAASHFYKQSPKNRLCLMARRIVRSFLSARRSAGQRGASLFICVWMVLQISETHNSKHLMFLNVDRFFVLFRADDVKGLNVLATRGATPTPRALLFYVGLVVRWWNLCRLVKHVRWLVIEFLMSCYDLCFAHMCLIIFCNDVWCCVFWCLFL